MDNIAIWMDNIAIWMDNIAIWMDNIAIWMEHIAPSLPPSLRRDVGFRPADGLGHTFHLLLHSRLPSSPHLHAARKAAPPPAPAPASRPRGHPPRTPLGSARAPPRAPWSSYPDLNQTECVRVGVRYWVYVDLGVGVDLGVVELGVVDLGVGVGRE